MYRLIFLNGKMKGRRVAVQQGSIVIGRDPACHLELPDPDAALRHATIEERGGSYFLCSTDIANRLLVNGQPVAEAALKNGDKVEIGTTQFEFQVMLDHAPAESRRRTGLAQVFAVVAMGAILLAELWFIVIVPLRQKKPTFDNAALEKARTEAKAKKAAAGAVVSAPVIGDADTREARERIEVMAATSNDAPSVIFTSPAVASVEGPVPQPRNETNISAIADPVLPPAVVAALTADVARVELPAMPAVDADNLVLAESRRMLQAALARASTGDLSHAEQMIDRIQLMAPDFIEAYSERAKIFEKQGRHREAFGQWQQVEKLAKGTPLAANAKTEQLRMVKLEKETKETKDAPTASKPKPSAGNGNVHIVSIERERFQASNEFDEMRVIRVNLRPRRGGSANPEDVRVLVSFYDRDADTGKISPTRAMTPSDALRLEGSWAAGESKSVTATYTAPKNFRAEELRVHNERREYFGHRVQVFLAGELADESASSPDLLALPAPKLPSPTLPAADQPVGR